jgi:hypothetical protein
VAVTPDDETLEHDVEEVDVVFEYDDELSDVDRTSIAVTVNGHPVSGSDRLDVTPSSTTLTLPVSSGEEYTVTVTVADQAGNPAEFTTTFDVEPEPDPVTERETDVDPTTPDTDESGTADDDADVDGVQVPGFGILASTVALVLLLLRLRGR